jgi:hypothetical protein
MAIKFFHKPLRQLAAMASLPFSTLRGGWGETSWCSGFVILAKIRKMNLTYFLLEGEAYGRSAQEENRKDC